MKLHPIYLHTLLLLLVVAASGCGRHHVNNLLLQALLADEDAYRVVPLTKSALRGVSEPILATA